MSGASSVRIFALGVSLSQAKELIMAKYGKKAGTKVKQAMHERKRGTLKNGKSGKKVKSRKQAIAIGLAQARHSGAKVPQKKGSKSKKGSK
jgi:hypothetical protein